MSGTEVIAKWLWPLGDGVCKWKECWISFFHAALYGDNRTTTENGTSRRILWMYEIDSLFTHTVNHYCTPTVGPGRPSQAPFVGPPSLHPFIYLSSVHQFTTPIHLSIRLSTHPPVCSSIILHPCIHTSICPSACHPSLLSISPAINPWICSTPMQLLHKHSLVPVCCVTFVY